MAEIGKPNETPIQVPAPPHRIPAAPPEPDYPSTPIPTPEPERTPERTPERVPVPA
jgi:hypothetical protein